MTGTAETRGNLIASLHLNNDEMEAHLGRMEEKYRRAEENDVRAEEWRTEDAEIVLVGYGIMGRILKAVAAEARAAGLKVGVLRPITLFPFPKPHLKRLAKTAQVFVAVEMSNGQMVEDVRLALNGARPVEFYSRVGGNVPTHEEVLGFVRKLARKYLPATQPEEECAAHV